MNTLNLPTPDQIPPAPPVPTPTPVEPLTP